MAKLKKWQTQRALSALLMDIEKDLREAICDCNKYRNYWGSMYPEGDKEKYDQAMNHLLYEAETIVSQIERTLGKV